MKLMGKKKKRKKNIVAHFCKTWLQCYAINERMIDWRKERETERDREG